MYTSEFEFFVYLQSYKLMSANNNWVNKPMCILLCRWVSITNILTQTIQSLPQSICINGCGCVNVCLREEAPTALTMPHNIFDIIAACENCIFNLDYRYAVLQETEKENKGKKNMQIMSNIY